MELYPRSRRSCHVKGTSICEAARLLGLQLGAVRKMLRHTARVTTRARAGPFYRMLPRDPLNRVIERIF